MQRIANAYFRSDPASHIELSGFNEAVAMTLELPAGRYLVFGKLTMRNVDEAQNASVRLSAQDGTETVDQTSVRLGHFEGIFHNDFFDAAACVDVQGTLTVAAPMDIVDLRCATFNGSANLGSLIAMEIDGDVLIAKGNGIALKSFGDTVVARLRLAGGRYLISGKAVVLNFDGDAQDATVGLATKDGAVVLTSLRVRLERSGDGDAQSVVARAVLDAADGDFIDLRCSTFNGVARDVVLTALPVADVAAGTAVDDEPDGRGGFAARRLAAFGGHQIVLGSIALPNLDGDNQVATGRLRAGQNADAIDETFVDIPSNGAALLSTQGILQGAAAGTTVELDWAGFINGNRFHSVPRDASLVAIAVDRVNPAGTAPPLAAAAQGRALLQGNFGRQGNFEAVVPLGNRLAHFFRDNDAPGGPWHGPFVFFDSTRTKDGKVAPVPFAPTAVSLVQSNFVTPGNLELVVRLSPTIGEDRLVFFFRDALGWHGPFDIVADGQPITGVTGNPVMIQSNFGRLGNFEMVVPLGNRLAHYFRDNDAPGAPWHGPFVFFDSTLRAAGGGGVAKIPVAPTAVSLVQSNFVTPGKLELVVRLSPTIGEDRLVFFFRDASGWHGPFDIVADGQPVAGVTGTPALIQSNFGRLGNFEMVVPLGSRLAHYFRDNDAPGAPWHGPFVLFDSTVRAASGGGAVQIPIAPTAVSLVQSNFVEPGNLEMIVRLSPTIGEDRLAFFFRDASGWHGPFDIVSDGRPVEGVTGF